MNPCPTIPEVDKLFLRETPVLVAVFDREEWVKAGFGEAYDVMVADYVDEVGDGTWFVYSSQGYANIGQNLQDIIGLIKQKQAQTEYVNGCLQLVTKSPEDK